MLFLTRLLLVTLLSGPCVPQNEEEYIVLTVKSIAARQDSLLQKFDELEDKLLAKRELIEDKLLAENEQLENLKLSVGTCSTKHQISTFHDILATDECDINTNNCSIHATCRGSSIDFECSCMTGYSGDGFTCEDIDECEDDSNICGDEGVCINLPGTYTCTCQDGYEKQEDICQDFDECEDDSNVCGDGEVCINHPGNYSCMCQDGYEKQGDICQDTRPYECGNFDLAPGTVVKIQSENYPRNYPNKYLCIWDFMTLEGSQISISCSTFKLKHCKKSSVEITGGNLNQRYCGTRKNGVKAISANNSMVISFRTSGGKTKKGFHCKVSAADIDECKNDINVCGDGEGCINLPGNYTCSGICQDGYERQGDICQDVNECSQPNICAEDQKCANLPGSYKCVVCTGSSSLELEPFGCIKFMEEMMVWSDAQAKCNIDGGSLLYGFTREQMKTIAHHFYPHNNYWPVSVWVGARVYSPPGTSYTPGTYLWGHSTRGTLGDNTQCSAIHLNPSDPRFGEIGDCSEKHYSSLCQFFY